MTSELEMRARPSSALSLVACLGLSFAAAAIGSALTLPNIDGWYGGLAKPAFNPPDWVFGPVWTVLYAMMGIALWRIRRFGEGKAREEATLAFLAQLLLNVAWSAAFFALHSPRAGLVVIAALLVAIVTTIRFSARVDGLAALLLMPYLAWVFFASVLNLAIAILN
jgi:tryptophan-rich sensory protein